MKQPLNGNSRAVRIFHLRSWNLPSIQAFVCFAVSISAQASQPISATERPLPNILWLVAEDINPHLGCYGDSYARTPNLDRFAASGLRYRNCWSAAPVCAPARTALISGVYPTSLGAEHMRSLVTLPPAMRLYPQLLRERGYYCSNNNKEDYNLTGRGMVWDESSRQAHWRNRKPGQPFFAVFNHEICHESQIRNQPHTLQHDPAQVRLPAYHPDRPEVRRDWAQYYDRITEMDAQVGKRLNELKEAGLAGDTVVFFYGDNGSGMPRSKRWPYNSGLNVPLIIHVPEKYKHLATEDYVPGGASERLVNFVDFAPTLLSLAGVNAPDWIQGHAFMGQFARAPQRYLFGFRGRMDERYDLVRSVRNERYIYIRNYMPHLIYGQYLDYMFQTPTTRIWKQLYDAGQLRPPQTLFWEPKAPEELYDLQNDPDEVRNLAASPDHQEILSELRSAQREHMLRIRDAGFLPEPELHTRSAGTTIFETAQDSRKYPLERILSVAETASMLKPEAAPQLFEALADSDSAVRYWGALGIQMRGASAVNSARVKLLPLLDDPAPSVRVVVAGALGRYGNDADKRAAARVLNELAAPDRNGAYISMMCLNAIQGFQPKPPPELLEKVRTMPLKDPAAPERANSYVSRLVEELIGTTTTRTTRPAVSNQRKAKK